MPANSAAWKAIFSLLLRPPFCRFWQKRAVLSPSITCWEKAFCPPAVEHRRKLWSNGYCCWKENYEKNFCPKDLGGCDLLAVLVPMGGDGAVSCWERWRHVAVLSQELLRCDTVISECFPTAFLRSFCKLRDFMGSQNAAMKFVAIPK